MLHKKMERMLEQSFEKLFDFYDTMVELFGAEKALEAIQRHYQDVHLKQDLLIQSLLSGFQTEDENFFATFLETHKNDWKDLVLGLDQLLFKMKKLIQTNLSLPVFH